MASIFLSYSREDSVRAGRIAQALELAGHDVWWDRRIGAGSRFSKEIDAVYSFDVPAELTTGQPLDPRFQVGARERTTIH